MEASSVPTPLASKLRETAAVQKLLPAALGLELTEAERKRHEESSVNFGLGIEVGGAESLSHVLNRIEGLADWASEVSEPQAKATRLAHGLKSLAAELQEAFSDLAGTDD